MAKIFVVVLIFCQIFPKLEGKLLKKPFTLKVSAMLPLTGKIAPMETLCTAPLEMVLDRINENFEILPNYNLVVDSIDAQCSAAIGVEKSMNFYLNENNAVDLLAGNVTNFKIGQTIFPNNFTFLHETAKIGYIPPILAGPICSGICQQISRYAKIFKKVLVSFF